MKHPITTNSKSNYCKKIILNFIIFICFSSLSLLLVSALTSDSVAGAVSKSASTSLQSISFSDIEGTPYCESVMSLSRSGIINGYPDGSFRPYGSLTRAEAATLIYRAYGSSSLALYNNRSYSDVASSMWATSYIDYCSATGVVNGYPDGTFHPDSQVTYNEIITMIVRARGMDDGTLSWPDGYINAARADGMLQQLSDITIPPDGGIPASRGKTAILISSGSAYNKTAASGPTVDLLTDPNMKGLCYGILTSAKSTTDRLNHDCISARFLMGSTIYDVLASRDQDALYAHYNPVYGLFQMQIKEGRVISAKRITEKWNTTSSAGLLTPAAQDSSMTEFCRITEVSDSSISYHAASGQSGTISLTSNTVCYELGLSSGSISVTQLPYTNIQKQDMVAVYSVKGKEEANVVLFIHPAYTSDLLHASENRDVMYLG